MLSLGWTNVRGKALYPLRLLCAFPFLLTYALWLGASSVTVTQRLPLFS